LTDISDKEQYDRLTQDWRQIHNVIWGIPSVAISIISAVIIVAYQPQLEGWPRILTLGVGSIFLFSMTVEIVKKRLTMDAISARMQRIEGKKEHQLTFGEFPSKTNKLIIELEEAQKQKGKNDPTEGRKKKSVEGTRDIPYKLFRLSHARASLTYVLFVAAILASILTYWEFVKYLNYEWWSHLLGITTVVIICIVIARRIKKERREYVKEKLEYDEEQKKLKKEVEEKRLDQEKRKEQTGL
jgi:hypothetical protein